MALFDIYNQDANMNISIDKGKRNQSQDSLANLDVFQYFKNKEL